jgi:electron transport complex protein RnfD
MFFASGIAPHWRAQDTVPAMMRQVIYALIPAIMAHVWFFGIGILINCSIAIAAALMTEVVVLWLRKRPVRTFISDYSAVVTAVLFAFCLPPMTP